MHEGNAPHPDRVVETDDLGRPRFPREGRTATRDPGESSTNRPGGLVLTRRVDQSIVIADRVEVQVVEIKWKSVRLKITAPRSIPVHRREVFEAIRSDPRSRITPGPKSPDREPTPTALGSLVLTRQVGEQVMIGAEVAVEVAEIRPGAVRLRIVAPRHLSVHRHEIQEAIRRGETLGSVTAASDGR